MFNLKKLLSVSVGITLLAGSLGLSASRRRRSDSLGPWASSRVSDAESFSGNSIDGSSTFSDGLDDFSDVESTRSRSLRSQSRSSRSSRGYQIPRRRRRSSQRRSVSVDRRSAYTEGSRISAPRRFRPRRRSMSVGRRLRPARRSFSVSRNYRSRGFGGPRGRARGRNRFHRRRFFAMAGLVPRPVVRAVVFRGAPPCGARGFRGRGRHNLHCHLHRRHHHHCHRHHPRCHHHRHGHCRR